VSLRAPQERGNLKPLHRLLRHFVPMTRNLDSYDNIINIKAVIFLYPFHFELQIKKMGCMPKFVRSIYIFFANLLLLSIEQ